MLKYLFIILILIVICLLVSNDLTNKQLEITEKKNSIHIQNLSGSSEKVRNLSNQTVQESKQNTCCNSHYKFSDKYTLAKLNKICNLVPIEIKSMSKCLEIDKTKRKEFDLEVSDRIEEWIEQRMVFEEVICAKIKTEINSHTKQLLSNALPIELSKSSNGQQRLSKEEIFELIKSISNSLGLNEMNTFENEILSNDHQSNKLLVNRRAIELLSEVRRVGKMLAEENRKQVIKTAHSRNSPQINYSTQSKSIDLLPIQKPTQKFDQPINQPKNSMSINQYKHPKNFYNHRQPPFAPPSYRRQSVDDNLNAIEEKSLITRKSNDYDNQNSAFSLENCKCVEIKLDPSIVQHILKTYPNITITEMNKTNVKSIDHPEDDERLKGELQNRSFFPFWSSNKVVDKLESSEKSETGFNNLTSKLIQQFASSAHDNITLLASETLQNHSRACDQEFLPIITGVLSLSHRLKHASNNYGENTNDEVNTLCDHILKEGVKLTYQLEHCSQSFEMRYMLKHTFNETETSLKFCMSSEFKNRLINTGDQVSESEDSTVLLSGQHVVSNGGDRSNSSDPIEQKTISNKTLDCLDWSKLKSCQTRFIPWFELIEINELKKLFDNRTVKFNEMSLFRRNVTRSLRNGQFDSIGELNCKDIMLFENCVKQDLEEDLFTVSDLEQDSRLVDLNYTTCQFGVNRLNRAALINNLANKIIDEVNIRVTGVCPKLNSILLLNNSSTDKENLFKINTIKHLTKQYTDTLNDQECSQNTMSFVRHCSRIYNSQIEPSYVQFYKNFELQNYFGKAFVKNDLIFPRICCAQRQLVRCFITSANFKCSKNKERTERLLRMGELPYCDEINSKMSMSHYRRVLSIKVQNSSSSSRFTSLPQHSLLILMSVLFLIL